jgi:PAS domain S-box-containing protein
MACIVRDITEQHRAAEELGAANAKLSRLGALISATSDFVAIGRLDGSVLFVNEAGRRMVGMAGDANLSGTRVGDFHPPAVLNLIEREGFPTMLREGAWHAEIALRHRDGHEIPVSIVGVVLKSPEGLPEYIGCVMRDISGQRQLEESLRSALAREKELNRLKSNFVSMVTHEIRTPLAHILGSSEILQRYLDRLPLEKREQHLQTIIDGVHRLSTLMEEVLLFSRAEAGRIEFNTEEIDLKAYCAQLVGEVAQATRHRCPVELDSEEFSIPARADENLMRHIFTNLLTNAVKYSASGTAVRFSIAREGVEAVFIVRDFGIGISEDDRKALFTPFYRGKNAVTLQGTGLGLVIVKHCVEHHGGTIEISSTEHQGTTVIVRLPLFEQAAANLARAPLPQNPPHP